MVFSGQSQQLQQQQQQRWQPSQQLHSSSYTAAATAAAAAAATAAAATGIFQQQHAAYYKRQLITKWIQQQQNDWHSIAGQALAHHWPITGTSLPAIHWQPTAACSHNHGNTLYAVLLVVQPACSNAHACVRACMRACMRTCAGVSRLTHMHQVLGTDRRNRWLDWLHGTGLLVAHNSITGVMFEVHHPTCGKVYGYNYHGRCITTGKRFHLDLTISYQNSHCLLSVTRLSRLKNAHKFTYKT